MTAAITGTASNFGRGINKTVCIAPETVFGVAPEPGAVPGQLLRRTSAMFNLQTNLIASQEINQSAQTEDARQGPRTVTGTLAGQLSPSSYTYIWEALLRNNFVAGTVVAALADTVMALNNVTGALELSSPSTNWSTEGIKQGDVIRLSSLSGGAAVDNGTNLRVVYISTPVGGSGHNTLGLVAVTGVVPWSSGETDTVSVVGKKLIMPPSGAIIPSFTIEEYYADIEQSDLSSGCRVTQASFSIPASGFATFSASFTGRNQVTAQGAGSQVFTAPAPVTTTTAMTAVGGSVIYKGVPILYISNLNLQVSSAAQADPMVGSQYVPDVFLGELTCQGSFSALLAPDSMTADYLNEVEVDLSFTLTTGPLSNADFMQIYLPRVKIASQNKTDSDRNISRSYNFRGLRNLGTVANADLTTIVLQDSLA